MDEKGAAVKKYLIYFCLTFSLCFGQQDLLQRSEIQNIMQQIFSQHLGQQALSGKIIANSYKIFIEQFDPEGIYLLQSEVDPYFNMNPQEVATLEREYQEGNFSDYIKLNDLIQKAISRARSYRSQLEQNPQALYEAALSAPRIDEKIKLGSYPATLQELQDKIKKSMVSYLQAEIQRFGIKGTQGSEEKAIMYYEKQLRTNEDQYTYRQENGEMMGAKDQENLFTLHVLKALAKSLDSHTAFFNTNEAYDMRVRLEKDFDGIGIVFQQSPQGIVVSSLLDGGPAARSQQIQVGDQLLELDGKKVDALDFEQVMELLKGEKNKPVKLVFKRPGTLQDKVFKIALKRETIVLNTDRVDVSYEQFGNGIIGKIILHSFYQNDQGVTSEKDVRNAIKQLDKEGNLRGLILDLRENSGGFLSQAVKVVGLFISNGVVVISKYSNGDEKIYRDVDNSKIYNGPLIVLTSRATASAAEIVAQALQDYGVALVVGDDRTYGKGTIQSQTVTDQKSGSYFKVTVGEYYTVSGKTPQLKGVRADVIVPGVYSQMEMGEKYLSNPIKPERKIPSEYKDNLSDIDRDVKPWFLHYYVPTIQKKEAKWRKMIPELKRNSSYRLERNKNYQLFIKHLATHSNLSLKEELEEQQRDEENYGVSDLQLSEATNILKDMIYIHSKTRLSSDKMSEYMIGSEPKSEWQEISK